MPAHAVNGSQPTRTTPKSVLSPLQQKPPTRLPQTSVKEHRYNSDNGISDTQLVGSYNAFDYSLNNTDNGSGGGGGGVHGGRSISPARSSSSSPHPMHCHGHHNHNNNNNNNNGADSFSIIVAARIRPFDKNEMAHFRETQRKKRNGMQSLSHAERVQLNLSKHQQRQPFGSPIVSPVGNGGGSAFDDDLIAGKLDGEEPVPIVDVDSDGTVVLRDPSNPHVARGAFAFDHVFSCFAPSVEIDDFDEDEDADAMNQNRNGRLLMDSVSYANATPEEDEQAEAEQRQIYLKLGKPLIESALQGYNACIFAYGQTGSGKTYTMIGSNKHLGIIPRLCHDLFVSTAQEMQQQQQQKKGTTKSSKKSTIRVTISYMEIYNEKVRDLLKQRSKNAVLHYNSRFDSKDIDHEEYQALRVRQHPQKGLFVEGLTTIDVNSWDECKVYLQQGSQLRTQCSTRMNEVSSRSHAIFQMVVTRSEYLGTRVRGKEFASERSSKINLVDLAGSERNAATGKHLTEANSINVSLSTLRRVIDGLVSKKKGQVIPYRESLLTYVLSDNFGGNSKTVMCANISPCEGNLNETESTLRYATLARSVRNRVKINESPSAKVIRELRGRVRQLQEELSLQQSTRAPQQQSSPLSNTLPTLSVPPLDLQQHNNTNNSSSNNNNNVNKVVSTECSSSGSGEVGRLRQREEELQRHIADRVRREDNLLNDLRRHEAAEEKWRREAERHRAHTDRMRRTLQRLAQNPDFAVMGKELIEEVEMMESSPSPAEREGDYITSKFASSPPPPAGVAPRTTLPDVQRKAMLQGLHVEGGLEFSQGRGTPLSLMGARNWLDDGGVAPSSAPVGKRRARQAEQIPLTPTAGPEERIKPLCLPDGVRAQSHPRRVKPEDCIALEMAGESTFSTEEYLNNSPQKPPKAKRPHRRHRASIEEARAVNDNSLAVEGTAYAQQHQTPRGRNASCVSYDANDGAEYAFSGSHDNQDIDQIGHSSSRRHRNRSKTPQQQQQQVGSEPHHLSLSKKQQQQQQQSSQLLHSHSNSRYAGGSVSPTRLSARNPNNILLVEATGDRYAAFSGRRPHRDD